MVKTDDLQLIVELADQELPRELMRHYPALDIALSLHHPSGYGTYANYYLERDYGDAVWINIHAKYRPQGWAEV